MANRPTDSVNLHSQRELERALYDLVLRYGAGVGPELRSKVERCVQQIQDALTETARDSKSLSPLDVVRIRAGKFAASLTPPSVFRDPAQLSRLRAEIHEMAHAFVGPSGAQGSRFWPGPRD